MARGRIWTPIALVLLFAPGCASVNEYANESLLASRASHLARKAWREENQAYRGHQFLNDLKQGFMDGYISVVNGGNGCPPCLPPEKYWTVCYLNPEGHARVNTWYEGFHNGALAAELDGVQYWAHIPTNFRDCKKDNGVVVVSPVEGPSASQPAGESKPNAVAEPLPVAPPAPMVPPPAPETGEMPMLPKKLGLSKKNSGNIRQTNAIRGESDDPNAGDSVPLLPKRLKVSGR